MPGEFDFRAISVAHGGVGGVFGRTCRSGTAHGAGVWPLLCSSLLAAQVYSGAKSALSAAIPPIPYRGGWLLRCPRDAAMLPLVHSHQKRQKELGGRRSPDQYESLLLWPLSHSFCCREC